MTVLCDFEIRSLCEYSKMVQPFNNELLNPASLDVVLGGKIMIEVADQHDLIEMDISDRHKDDPYLMKPGEFCLAETKEVFNIPERISAQFVLKSSRAREGYENLLAGWCDPGWNGSKLTLELVNARRHHAIPLYPDLKIGQIVFFRMSQIPLNHYGKTGRYNGDLGVTGSKG